MVMLQRLMGDEEVSGAPPDGRVLHHTGCSDREAFSL